MGDNKINKDELKALLKEHLTIFVSISVHCNHGGCFNGVAETTICFDDEEICTSRDEI